MKTPDNNHPQRRVMVCQFCTCTKDGAAQVLATLQDQPIEGVTIEVSGCMGLCGSGPIVAIFPDNIYYAQVTPKKARQIIESHLLGHQPILTFMHPRLHPQI
ncbi:(2Fe-2S) ferredoxin domain-containing protein [Pseudanabaena biceps]|nr:(2Fe-2S) ferredoxin domain-containing protein [Pseudanabaena biceps]